MSFRTPKYRLHKGSGQALVQINGERTYLGKYGTEESKELYRKLVAEWLASGQKSSSVASTVPAANWPVSISELIDAGICRTRINQHVTRIRQMFKWGVARELVPETVWRALCAVEGLRFGEAIETEPIKPVPEEHIVPIEPFVTPQIWAMVNLQLWSACRPGEACVIRAIDINMQSEIWEYRAHTHKGEHHNKDRVIYLGPHAQKVIKPWLKSDLYAYLFSPREARAWFQAQRAKNRKTPMSPSHRKRKRRPNPNRAPGDRYNTGAYDHAIERACERAEIPNWTPNQLRHAAGTRIRSAYGIEIARIILGHSSAVTSEIYAEIDREKVRAILGRIG